ncbi:GIY-YIG nuclease family protein [Flammeovirgaceae bacterium SG7u.111]|nr:GIY-YIG nuclease family protein [Flammeovirgaceae bacterium SG7u.132]WPO38400.1 GIY-YIG nuclease family protein [Flammeovirgaceae bacterium SG7u.111]
MGKDGFVYIMSNARRTTLYIGVTSDLATRITQHKEGTGSAFCKKYNCTHLIYYEHHHTILGAIEREKQLKNWKRAWKDELIRSVNPEMVDLYDGLF